MSDAFIISDPRDLETAASAVVVLEQHGRRTRRLTSVEAAETDPVFISSKRRLVVMISGEAGPEAEELMALIQRSTAQLQLKRKRRSQG